MIHLRLLGSLDLLGADGAPMDEAMRRSKVVAVLAYLAAARPRGMHRRDKVAALFWPELSDDRARAALRVTLTRLRDDIGDEVIVSRGADDIAIDIDHLSCDVVQLDDAIDRGDVSAASALYRGHFMDGVHVEGTAEELEEWMSGERRRIRDELTRALLAAAKTEGAAGRTARAIAFARRAVEIIPNDESAHRLLIGQLTKGGDRSGALTAYADLERRLAKEFGVAPAPETRALVLPIQSEAPVSPMGSIQAEQVPGPVRVKRRPQWTIAAVLAGLLLVAGAAVARDRWTPAPPVAARWGMVTTRSTARPWGRLEGGAVLDSTGDGIILFGGVSYAGASSRILKDLSRLHGIHPGEEAQWVKLEALGESAIAPRWLFGMAYDRAHDRLLVHGGALGRTAPCVRDTWVLDHATGLGAQPAWRQVAISGPKPPPRAGIDAAYDAASRRLFFFGGHDCYSTFFNDVWVLTFDDSTLASGRWSALVPDTSHGVPDRRAHYGFGYDARTNRLFIHGGSPSTPPYASVWMLEHANGLGGTPAWRPLTCAGRSPARNDESAVFDTVSGSLIVFGGLDSTEAYRNDLWRLSGLGGDVGSCRWEPVTTGEVQPSQRGGATMMIDAASRSVFLFGGYFQDAGFADTWVLSDLLRRP